ncbi:MAG: hypothetical protein AAB425_07770 [Bdellovibrionota bacterium]
MGRVEQLITQFKEWLVEQEWFIQLREKWQELSPEQQQYAKMGGLGSGSAVLLGIVISSISSTHALKSELESKMELNQLILTAAQEMKRLKDSGSATGAGRSPDKGPWPDYLKSRGDAAGVAREAIEVSSEKSGGKTELVKESLFDVNLKKIGIKQIIRMAFQLENGPRPVKLRNLTIDTKLDPEGYMDARMAISAFVLQQPNPGTGK